MQMGSQITTSDLTITAETPSQEEDQEVSIAIFDETSNIFWSGKTAGWLAVSRAGAMQYQESRLHPLLLTALCQVYKAKLAADRLHAKEISQTDLDESARYCSQVLEEILNGLWKDQMLVSPLASPLGEAVMDNLNEIVAGRSKQLARLCQIKALEITDIAGGSLSAALDDADKELPAMNFLQAPILQRMPSPEPLPEPVLVELPLEGADLYLVVVRLTSYLALKDLETTLLDLERLVRRKSLEMEKKLRLAGQESEEELAVAYHFSQFGNAAERSLRRLRDLRARLTEVTINSSRPYLKSFVSELSRFTALTLKEGESAGPCPGVPREKYLSRSALSDLAQTGSALKEIGIELSRICQAIAGLEDLFKPLGDEDKCHQSYTSTLYQAALAAQGEEAKISLGLTASLRLQGLPALSMVCESILNSTDLLKSSLKSFNHAYIARLTLK